MRARRWVILLAIVAFLVTMIFIQGLRSFKANERLKNYIISELQPILGDAFTIGRVQMGVGTVHFRQIHLLVPSRKAAIDIRDVRIGYSLLRFLIRGFDPGSLSQDVIIVNPRLVLFYGPDSTKPELKPQSVRLDKIEFENTYKATIKKLGFFNRLSVHNGEILVRNFNKDPVHVAHAIEGWLSSDRTDSLQIRLAGKLFQSKEENLYINGSIDLSQGFFKYLNMSLEQCRLDNQISIFLPSSIVFSAGQLSGNLSVVPQQESNNHYNLFGNIEIVQARAGDARKKLSIENADIKASVNDWNITLQAARATINGAEVNMSGSISNVLNPVLALHLESDNISLSRLTPVILGTLEKNVRGIGRLRLDVDGPIYDPMLSVRFYANRMTIKGQTLHRVRSSTTFSHNRLNVSSLSAAYFYNKFQASGTIDFSNGQSSVDASVHARGDLWPLLQKFATNGLEKCSTQMDVDVSGDLINPTFLGNLEVDFVTREKDSLKNRAIFALHDGVASITSIGSGYAPKVNGRIYLRKSKPEFDLSISRIDPILFALFKVPQKEAIQNSIGVAVDVSGNGQKFVVTTKFQKMDGGMLQSRLADVSVTFERKQDLLTCRGNLVLHPQSQNPLSGTFSLTKDRNNLTIREFNLEDYLQVSGGVSDLGGRKTLFGDITVSQLKGARLLGQPDSTCSGWLDGNISLNGSVRSPQIAGHLKLFNLFCLADSAYESEVEFSYDSLGFDLKKLLVNSPQSTILYADGRFDAHSDSLDFSVKGAGFDIGQLTSAIRKTRGIIRGQSFIDLQLKGTPRQPQLFGIIAVKNGAFFKLPFDELEFRLARNDLDPLLSFPVSTPKLYFSKIKILRKNDFVLYGSGAYPINSNDSLHLSIEGEGNFLSLLSDLTDYFKDSKSQGVLTAKLTGTPERPILSEAHLQFSDGSMEFGSVIPPVTELSGDVSFEPENQFVHIHRLEGKMGGEWFRISNALTDTSLSARPIENLALGGNGLNFGVLMLESSERGIPLNIIGLMEPGVFGRLQLLGKAPGEKFYLAGPYDRPLLRGRINLRNFKFMYPFQESERPPNEIVSNVLKSIEWDVYVKPIKDVHYIKTLPGAVDNVYVNLQLDEKFGGLDFSGQIKDGSFRLDGTVRSTNGIIEYLNMDFRVERAGLEFDRSALAPVVYGKARTTVTDSLGIASQVFLTLQTVDETMDKKLVDDIVRQENARARWDRIRFKLSTDNPNFGTTEAQILASLGYSTSSLTNKAIDALGISTENLLFRPLYRPVERKLEQLLGFDYVRFSSRFTSNFFALNMNYNPELKTRLALLRSTKLILGKYLSNQLFLQYTGQVETGIDYQYQEKEVGLRHTIGLDYRINPQLLLELEYDYNSMILNTKDDKRIVLRHWFNF